MKAIYWAALVALALGSSASHGYELRTHGFLASEAYSRSIIATNPSFARELGISTKNQDVFGSTYFEVVTGVVRPRVEMPFDANRMPGDVNGLSVAGWLVRGAIREDDLTSLGCVFNSVVSTIDARWPDECNPQDNSSNFDRVLNHFYDPRFDRGLTGLAQGAKAVDWALGVGDAFAVPTVPDPARRNGFSLADARQAMYYALTGKDPRGAPGDVATRNAWWATTFRSLGDAMHLVQDMAQPQHTRNEPHAGSVFENYIEARAQSASFYRIDGISIETLPPISFDGARPDVPAVEARSRYSDFWSTTKRDGLTGGTGLADFSNRAFLTSGTNLGVPFVAYELPPRNPASYTTEAVTDPTLGPPGTVIKFLLGTNPEAGILEGGTIRGARLTTESAFSDFGVQTTPFSMNRFNYDDQAALLLPRAVAYSAGLLDYFFRGRIEFLTDPRANAQYLIRNLGDETMTGDFELYYDDTNGIRRKVSFTPGTEWRTDGLPPGFDLQVKPDFEVPTDAMTPNEYLLVFHGDMGEETRSGDNVGAVVANLIKAPRGALYIGGLDSQSRLMTIKIDAKGMRVLNGLDETGKSHITSIKPSGPDKDYDPLLTAIQASFGTPMSRVPRTRQSAISDGFFPSYEIISLAMARGQSLPLMYLQDAFTGEMTFQNGSDLTWLGATDAGDQFFFRVDSPTSTTWQLFYSATMKDGRSQSGAVPFPPAPGGSTSYPSAFRSGGFFLSPDGFKISTFTTTDVSGYTQYELQIAPTLPPSMSFVQIGSGPLSESLASDQTHTCDANGCVDHGLQATRTTHPPGYVEYIKGKLQRIVSNEVGSIESTNTAAGSGSDVDTNPGGCPYDIISTRRTDKSDSLKTSSTSTVTLEDTEAVFATSQSNGGSSFTNSVQVVHHTSGDGLPSPTRINCVGIVEDPPQVTSGDQRNPTVTDIGGTSVALSLTGDQSGTVFSDTSGDTTTMRFRGAPVPAQGAQLIGDAAPTGDVFVARADKAFVFYEPLRGSGMPPQITLPSNMVFLLGAIWN